jgi:hypothetical protein
MTIQTLFVLPHWPRRGIKDIQVSAPARSPLICAGKLEVPGRRPAAPWHNHTPACWRMKFYYADEIIKTLLDD